MKRKLAQVESKAQEIGYMGSAGERSRSGSKSHSSVLTVVPRTPDPLSSRVQGLVPQIGLLQERLATLAETPAPSSVQTSAPSAEQPWASRAAFVNWASTAKVDALPPGDHTVKGSSGQNESSNDAIISKLHDKMQTTGKQEDAAVSSGHAHRLESSLLIPTS